MTDYKKRFAKILRHINAHLDEPLTLEKLSELAHFSTFHFHRQFSAHVGASLSKYILHQRLKRAALQLALRPQQRIIDIALQAGFAAPEAFAHAFRKRYGRSPSAFRREPDWSTDAQFTAPTGATYMPLEHQLTSVEIVTLPQIHIAVLEHRGPPSLLGDSIRQFIQWRKNNGLHPSRSATYNLLYNDPNTTPANEFRLDLAAGYIPPLDNNSADIKEQTIPAGRYARLRHSGPDDNFGANLAFLYGIWLPQSGEALVDFPCFVQRLNLYPEVAEPDLLVDIFLPLR